MNVQNEKALHMPLAERTNVGADDPGIRSVSPKKVCFSAELVKTKDLRSPVKRNGCCIKSALRNTQRYQKKGIENTCAGREGRAQGFVNSTISSRVVRHEAEFEPDSVILRKVVSLLETKLADTQEAHKEALLQIEEQKQREMAKIYREALIEHKLAKHQQKKEEESSSHDAEVVRETITLFRENNNIIRRQNQEMMDEMEELEQQNNRLQGQIERFQKAIEKAKTTIGKAKEQQKELETTVEFLKARKTEYEDSKFQADIEIELEREEADTLKKKLEKIVEAIDQRCSDHCLAETIDVAVKKEFARIDTMTLRTLDL